MNKTYEELQDELHMCHERIAELEEREQALAAHLEGIGTLVAEVMASDTEFMADWDKLAELTLNGSPAEALARRDAAKQAEGADLFADSWGWGEFRPDEVDVRKWAASLRRQAEAAHETP
ncbi:hypothetical protein [Vreelandella titanicae]|uniref:hypothetical protein n=1 Tax=Vreelandella titanicae TaxID=664683 RepID=UPI00380F27E7